MGCRPRWLFCYGLQSSLALHGSSFCTSELLPFKAEAKETSPPSLVSIYTYTHTQNSWVPLARVSFSE